MSRTTGVRWYPAGPPGAPTVLARTGCRPVFAIGCPQSWQVERTGMRPSPSRCSWPGSGAAPGASYVRSRSTGGPWPSTKLLGSPKPGCAAPSRFSSRLGSSPGTSLRQARSTSALRAAFSVARSCTGSPRSMPLRSRQRMPALRQPVERHLHPAGQYPRVLSPNRRQRPTSPLPGSCSHPKSPKSNP